MYRRVTGDDMATDYGQRLLDPRWQKLRLKVFERDNYTCINCGDADSPLHCHHLRYFRNAEPWDYHEVMLVTLCDPCHEAVHGGKLLPEEWLGITMRYFGATKDDLRAMAGAFSHIPSRLVLDDDDWTSIVDGIANVVESIVRARVDAETPEPDYFGA